MANLTSTLAIRLTDDVSGPAGRAAGALRTLGASGKDLARLAAASPEVAGLTKQLDALHAKAAKISTFKAASSGLDTLGLDLRKARQDIVQAQALVARKQKTVDYFNRIKVENPDRYRTWKMDGLADAVAANLDKAKRAHGVAVRALPSVTADFVSQGRTVRALRAELTALGVPLKGVKAAEAAVQASIADTNKAIADRPAALARAEAKAAEVAQTRDRKSVV